MLRYYADLSVAETADALDCAPGTVKSLTAKAVAGLRVRLGEAVDPVVEPDPASGSEPGVPCDKGADDRA